MYFNLSYFDENNNPTEVQVICEKCGKIISVKEIEKFSIIKTDYCVVENQQSIICDCGNSGNGLIEYKKNPEIKKTVTNNYTQSCIPHCPTCHSTRVKRISGTAKVAGAVAFGLLSKTARSQFQCENCGYKW